MAPAARRPWFPIVLLGLAGLGLAALAWLLAHYGIAETAGAVAAIGWGLALMLGVRLALIAGAGLAWWMLPPPGAGVGLWTCLRLRWVRESINSLLPVAQMGGDIVGARLLAKSGVDGEAATASVIVDVFVQAGTQLLFTLLGLAALVALGGDPAIVRGVLAGLAVVAPALLAFFLVQMFGGFGWAQRRINAALASVAGLGKAGDGQLDRAIRDIYRRRRALAACVLVHALVWLLGVAEIWIALHFMGHAVDWTAALVIESLAQAVRAAAFVVPGGLGVQEGGFIALCATFGLPPAAALALSLARRACEFLPGIAGLVAWHVEEGAGLLRRTPPSL